MTWVRIPPLPLDFFFFFPYPFHKCGGYNLVSEASKPSGRVAERSKALVLGTSHFDDVGSNPTPAISFFLLTSFICDGDDNSY